MSSDERELKRFVDRHLPSPTHMEFAAARDRVLDEARVTPSHLLRPRIAESDPPISWKRTGVALVAAAAVIALVVAFPFKPANWIATVEAADGSSYRLEPNTVLSATDASSLRLALKDGSRVEMRSASKLSLDTQADGIGIRLLAGDIIVNAAAPGAEHLSVETRDMTVLVAGTVSLVKAAADGSRVGVIKGEARVREGGVEKVLRPGEQSATSPALAARPLRDDVAWSRDANAHLAVLDAFSRGIAQTAGTLAPVAPTPAPSRQTPVVGGQVASAEFEEASIRECDPDNLPPSPIGARGGGANSVMMTPGRYYALCITPATLIRVAWGYRAANVEALVPDTLPRGGRAPIRGRFGVVGSLGMEDGLRVRGGPDWVRKTHFTIEAVADDMADGPTMSGPMLRALFEKRFKLKMHVETEQTAAYNLVVAPGGLKIKPVSSGACEMPVGKPGAPLLNGLPQGPPRPLADIRRGKPTCGLTSGPNGPNWVVIGGESTFGALTQELRNRFDKGSVRGIAITDKTGITDTFNFDLESAVDASAGRGGGNGFAPAPDAGGDVPRAPTIFAALEEQLGLRLEPVQVPREYLVIDSIEKPGPN